MIYTCTTNPSLDYYIKLEEGLKIGEMNRSVSEHFITGGKGVNVSIELNNLMIPSVAMGFLGGFVKEYYLKELSAYPYIQARFTTINGSTRINLKLNSGTETYINARGPKISDDEFSRMATRLDKVDEGDIFVLSGTIQEEIIEGLANVVHILASRGVKIILDTSPELIQNTLECKPYLIKPNVAELEDISGHIITDEDSLIDAARSLIVKGAHNVLVSVGKDGAYLIDENSVYCHRGLEGKVISTTGCGDAMVAGYVFNLQRGANSLEAFQYACASGSATAFSDGMATRSQIDEIIDKIEIERLK